MKASGQTLEQVSSEVEGSLSLEMLKTELDRPCAT